MSDLNEEIGVIITCFIVFIGLGLIISGFMDFQALGSNINALNPDSLMRYFSGSTYASLKIIVGLILVLAVIAPNALKVIIRGRM